MKYIVTILLFCSAFAARAQFPVACDTDRDCIGKAITQTVTQKTPTVAPHYTEVDKTASQQQIKTALTVEMWMKAQPQAGMTQYIAGLWGPGADNNDVWVLYITPQNELVFEINGTGTKLGSTDNTTARTSANGLYNSWNHIAGVFDGATQTTKLYVNGREMASARNAQYPASTLHTLEKADLPIQIGSASAFSNSSSNRTLLGQLDEVRIWSRAVSPDSILCQKDRSLTGNEPGLILYYRCNELQNVFDLCDATGNGNIGRMRSGARCVTSDRKEPQNFKFSPASITDDVKCADTKTFTITVEDTSICGSSVLAYMGGRDKNSFKNTPTDVTFVPGQPVTFTIDFKSPLVGDIQAQFEIHPKNRCGQTVIIPINIKRTTELAYSLNRVTFDTLYANCTDRPYIDTTVTIYNRSRAIGTARTMTVSGVSTNMPQVFAVLPMSLPAQIPADDSLKVKVRFFSRDSSAVYNDTLKILSDDNCPPGIGLVPLRGIVQEVISIRTENGQKRIDSIKFASTCPGQLSDPVMYVWQNLTSRGITIDEIIIPPGFTGRTIKLPATLLPKTGYQPNFFRFRPLKPGFVSDSIIFKTQINGCTIEKKVFVSGNGYSSDVEFSVQNGLLDFGKVIVGQEKTLTVTATNKSIDTLKVSFYLEAGEVYFKTGANGTTLLPGATQNIPITFRPLKDSVYLDKLCLFEQRCFTVDCIQIRGEGIIEDFKFEPQVLKIENVPGCQSATGVLKIVNNSAGAVTLSQFVLNDPSGRFTLIAPTTFPATQNITPNSSAEFTFRYTPNDVSGDRADRAYLEYKTLDGVSWKVQLYGTSAAPKLFITPLTTFGTIEVGDKKVLKVLVENVSSLPVTIDNSNIQVPVGFSAISFKTKTGTFATLPVTVMQPRDSVTIDVEFAPTAVQKYDSFLKITSSIPCDISATGELKGAGEIVRLDVKRTLVHFGYVRPCDCGTETVVMVNRSIVNEMRIDSVWIDSLKVPNGTPQFFTWKSTFSPSGIIPYTIPKDARDTILITYCPRSPSEIKFIDNAAKLHILGSGAGWTDSAEVFLAGKRSLLFSAAPSAVQFVPRYVDLIDSQYVQVVIPSEENNPNQEAITIDSVSFTPDDRVFTAQDELLKPFPLTVQPGDTLRFRVEFKPRAPKLYKAVMNLHMSQPCRDIDTTIHLAGTGFAGYSSLDFTFENNRAAIDTFEINTCDTLVVPVYASREVPANVVDISFRFGYDTTELRFIDALSPYTSTPCPPYTPQISDSLSQWGGSDVFLKNFCKVDSLQPMVLARFVPVNNVRSSYMITIDSIGFDTPEVIFYKIIAGNDVARVIVHKPEFQILNPAVFDSVRILDCAERTITVLNTGDVAMSIDSVLKLPKDFTISAAIPALQSLIPPGDSIIVFLKFCPTQDSTVDSSAVFKSSVPCSLDSATQITAIGYAPEFPVSFGMQQNVTIPANFDAAIGDTITLPVFLGKDFSATYDGITYWLKRLSFDVNLRYNPYALKFLKAESEFDMTVNEIPGKIALEFLKLDSVRAGKIADAKFVVTVPDKQQSPLYVSSLRFKTDSIMFLKILPDTTESNFTVNGKCNLTFLKYTNIGDGSLMQNVPNPATGHTRIDFQMQETVPVVLKIFSSNGAFVETLLDGSEVLKGGQYSVDFDVSNFPSGVYYYTIQAGIFMDTKPMVIAK
ncbi:MAG: choice-of-anchor D domain-containing protein [Bacteroidota bacterium]